MNAIPLLLILSSIHCHAHQVFLKAPSFSNDLITETKIEKSASRTQGIRIEAERVGDKLVVHNYGYGTNGLCLAWGGAQEAVQLMERIALIAWPKKSMIGVIGAGIAGLTVAQRLLEKGYNVTLYAHDFPPYTHACNGCALYDTQEISMQHDPYKKRLKRIQKASYDVLHAMAQKPLGTGVKAIDCYTISSQSVREAICDCELIFNGNHKKRATHKKTFVVTGSSCMQALFDQVKTKGIRCEVRILGSLQEVAHLPHSILFNCTELGARTLCNDTSVTIQHYPEVWFKNTARIEYALIDHTQQCAIVPSSDCLVVRHTAAMNNEDSAHVQTIQATMTEHLQQEHAAIIAADSAAAWANPAVVSNQTIKAYEESIAFALRKLQCKGNEKILLLGCDNVSVIMQLSTQVKQGTVECIDIVPELVVQAEQTCSACQNCTYRLMDTQEQLPAHSYDYCVAIMNMHVPFDQRLLEGINKSLKPKGAFLCMALRNEKQPLVSCINQILKKISLQEPHRATTPFTITEPSTVKTMLTAASFKAITMSESSCPLHFATAHDFYQWTYALFGYSGWLSMLDVPAKQACLMSIVDAYKVQSTPMPHGALRYDMPFVLIYAQK